MAPAGEERGAPHYTVFVSPQRPLEIVLPTLPEFQDAAVSRECLSQFFPPGNVAELRASPRLQGSPEQLRRLFPASPPCQGIDLAAPNTPEASLERLAPLVDCLVAWKLLPNVSRWVLQTVEKGYRIQFGAPPPPFNELFLTCVSPEQALVLEQEVSSLLRKEAIEVVPPLDRESGFYSRYFVVPKKDGGLRPILDLRLLNRSVRHLKFRMLTVKQVVSQIRSEDWFVTIDLKDAYFHISILPSHRKFLSFAFGGKAYQYRVINTLTPNFHEVRGCCPGSSETPGHPGGKDPLITRFLHGVMRLRPRVRSRVPPWDLAVVLEALCIPPFEPIEEVSERLLTLKTVLLLAISSLKRFGDLQALSVAPSFLDVAPCLAKSFLYPREGYVPKVPSSVPRPVVLQAFCPPPFREPDQEKLNCMCPVRALDAYVHRTALWRKTDQLLVCYGPPKKGLPAAKQTLSRCIVDAVILAYESSDLPSPLGSRLIQPEVWWPPRPFSQVFQFRIFVTLLGGLRP